MKARLAAVLLAVAFLLCGIDPASLQPQGYVSDFARVLDASAKQDLERYCKRVEEATGVQMALVTLPTLENAPVEDFANDLFRRWGIGQKGKDEGLLLLLVIGDRRSRLEVGRGLEQYITDGTSGSLLREMRPALRESRYAEAFGTAAHSLGQRIAEAKGVSIPEESSPRRRVREEPGAVDLPVPMLIGILVIFLLLASMSRGRRGGGGGGFLPGLILGNMMSRSPYRGQGGGGFGGYDSGDSFGGFGGGDSGGGGASSNW